MGRGCALDTGHNIASRISIVLFTVWSLISIATSTENKQYVSVVAELKQPCSI